MNDPFDAGGEAQARLFAQGPQKSSSARTFASRRRSAAGLAALEQARLIMLVMINVAQLWILSATVEATLAQHYQEIWPLVIASSVCWLISLSIILWWKPASRRYTSTGYLREKR
jgi:hypothetical protein